MGQTTDKFEEFDHLQALVCPPLSFLILDGHLAVTEAKSDIVKCNTTQIGIHSAHLFTVIQAKLLFSRRQIMLVYLIQVF